MYFRSMKTGPGAHSCMCDSGYEMAESGRECREIDNCAALAPCDVHATCKKVLIRSAQRVLVDGLGRGRYPLLFSGAIEKRGREGEEGGASAGNYCEIGRFIILLCAA